MQADNKSDHSDTQIESVAEPEKQEAPESQPEVVKKDFVPAKPAPITPSEPTEAELRLKEEAENAKTKLIEEIKQFKLDDQPDQEDEAEDPRVQKFLVTNPVKIQSNIKYTVEGVDDEGDFSEVRRYREFNALS